MIGIAYASLPPDSSAKPAAAAVSMPMTSPFESTSGPPESPGWMPAFVSSSPVSRSELLPSLAVIDLPRPVIVPVAAIGAPPAPPALPSAVTASPSCTFDESPRLTVWSPDAPFSCSTATSAARSYPTTVAEYLRPVEGSVTRIVVAPRITWLFVSTSPDELSTMPVPAAAAFW